MGIIALLQYYLFSFVIVKSIILNYRIAVFISLVISLSCSGFASGMQDQPVVNRSETIQIVDGKKYYFHPVLQGQTLFSISRAYGVSQEDIIKEKS